jgi:hypothetical protein
MPWQLYQRYRLASEKTILERDFSHFSFYSPVENTFISGTWTSSRSNIFTIRVELPVGYPDECPVTYITFPSPLYGKYKAIESYGTSHAMHCWTSPKPGWVKICTFRPEYWSAEFTLAMVALKAQLWLEALESHRETGRDIADFLVTWS